MLLVKNPRSNTPVERVHQLILNMFVTKDIDNKLFDYIDPWGETLASIAWAMRASYHHTIMYTPGQAVSGRYMLFNLAAVETGEFQPLQSSAKYTLIVLYKTPRKLRMTTQ